MRNSLCLLAFLSGSLLTACDDAAPVATATEPVVRDSAGITIVENSAPRWGDGETWRLSEEPVLEIGMMDGPEEYQFQNVMGAARFPDGRVAVADMWSGEVRFYDAAGRHQRSVGGRGEGPEEFRQILGLHRIADDEIAVMDQRRTAVIDDGGDFLRDVTPADFSIGITGWFADGRILAAAWPRPQPGESDRWIDSVTLHLLEPDGSEGAVVARRPAFELVASGPRPSQVLFSPRPAVTTAEDRFYYAYPDEYRIEVFSPEGRPKRQVRREHELRAVTPDDREAYRRALLDLSGERGRPVSPQLQEQRRRLADEAVYASRVPAFSRIRTDLTGILWVEDFRREHALPRQEFGPPYGEATRWSVFDPEGVWLGEVVTPPRFHVHEIGEDYVLGVYRDDLDVEFVRMHELIKPGADS